MMAEPTDKDDSPRKRRNKPPVVAEQQGADREAISVWFKAQIDRIQSEHELRVNVLRTVGEHPSPLFQRQVIMHAALGLPKAQIARLLGITTGILNAHYSGEIEIGIAEATKAVASSMLKIATDPDHPASGKVGMDWLARRGGVEWQKKDTLEVEDKRAATAPIIDSSKFTYEQRQQLRAMLKHIAEGGEGDPLQPDEELPVIEE